MAKGNQEHTKEFIQTDIQSYIVNVGVFDLPHHINLRGPLIAGTAVLVFAAGWAVLGLRVTFSGSLPMGLYRETSQRPQRGSILVLCPPPNPSTKRGLARGYLSEGACPRAGAKPLGKPVVGLPGDTVRLTKTGIWINGRGIYGSAPPLHDSNGRRLRPRWGRWVLPERTYYLYSSFTPKRSFDSRYLGPVSGNPTVLVPLLTWAWIWSSHLPRSGNTQSPSSEGQTQG